MGFFFGGGGGTTYFMLFNFAMLSLYKKFQNPRTNPSGRKVCVVDE